MEQLASLLLSNLVGYMIQTEEQIYLTTRWKCKKTTPELCRQLRQYQQELLPFPRMEDLIRYVYKPCDPSCPYFISMDDAVPLLLYSIQEYGRMLTCQSLFGMVLFHIREGRYPSEIELFLFEQAMRLFPQHIVPEPISESNRPPSPPLPVESYIVKKTVADQQCCICQESILMNQRVMTLPCMHTFHVFFRCDAGECLGIDSWLKKSNECPLCKQAVRS